MQDKKHALLLQETCALTSLVVSRLSRLKFSLMTEPLVLAGYEKWLRVSIQLVHRISNSLNTAACEQSLAKGMVSTRN